jgi:hypothetical protein
MFQAPSAGHTPKKKLRKPNANRFIESGFSLPPKPGSFSLVKCDDWKPVWTLTQERSEAICQSVTQRAVFVRLSDR